MLQTGRKWLFLKRPLKTRQSRDITVSKEHIFPDFWYKRPLSLQRYVVWADQPTAKKVILKNTYFLAQQLKNLNILFEI